MADSTSSRITLYWDGDGWIAHDTWQFGSPIVPMPDWIPDDLPHPRFLPGERVTYRCPNGETRWSLVHKVSLHAHRYSKPEVDAAPFSEACMKYHVTIHGHATTVYASEIVA
jgi:hypothetical protein